MKVSLIAAMDEKRGIGKNNQLLFKISKDLLRFKQLTTGHPVIMGRKTYESIGRALPKRTNIIVTRKKAAAKNGVEIVHSLEEAIETATEILKQVQDDNKKEVFVIGGGQIFAQAIGMADKLYLTIVQGDYDADTFFPEYENKGFKIVKEEKREENGYKFRFVDLER